MITETCFEGIGQMFVCLGLEMFGTMALASVAFLIMMAYLMNRSGMSFTASVPLSLILLFSLLWATGVDLFRNIVLVILLLSGAVIGIALLRHFYR